MLKYIFFKLSSFDENIDQNDIIVYNGVLGDYIEKLFKKNFNSIYFIGYSKEKIHVKSFLVSFLNFI